MNQVSRKTFFIFFFFVVILLHRSSSLYSTNKLPFALVSHLSPLCFLSFLELLLNQFATRNFSNDTATNPSFLNTAAAGSALTSAITSSSTSFSAYVDDNLTAIINSSILFLSAVGTSIILFRYIFHIDKRQVDITRRTRKGAIAVDIISFSVWLSFFTLYLLVVSSAFGVSMLYSVCHDPDTVLATEDSIVDQIATSFLPELEDSSINLSYYVDCLGENENSIAIANAVNITLSLQMNLAASYSVATSSSSTCSSDSFSSSETIVNGISLEVTNAIAQLINAEDTFTCESINPIYNGIVHSAVCDSLNDAIQFIFISLTLLVFSILVLVTLRREFRQNLVLSAAASLQEEGQGREGDDSTIATNQSFFSYQQRRDDDYDDDDYSEDYSTNEEYSNIYDDASTSNQSVGLVGITISPSKWSNVKTTTRANKKILKNQNEDNTNDDDGSVVTTRTLASEQGYEHDLTMEFPVTKAAEAMLELMGKRAAPQKKVVTHVVDVAVVGE
jgi:hypothetical protein